MKKNDGARLSNELRKFEKNGLFVEYPSIDKKQNDHTGKIFFIQIILQN